MFIRVLLIGVLAAALAPAQRGGGGGGMGEEGGGGRGDMGLPTIHQAPSTIDRIGGMLKLNKEQKKSVKAILDDSQKEAVPVRDQMTASRLAIAAVLQAGKSQADVDQAVNGYAALETRMTAIELNAFSKIFALLEPDQRKVVGPLFSLTSGLFLRKNWNESQ